MENLNDKNGDCIDAKTTKMLWRELKRRERLTGKRIKLMDFFKSMVSEALGVLDPNDLRLPDRDAAGHGNKEKSGSFITFKCGDKKTRRELEKRS